MMIAAICLTAMQLAACSTSEVHPRFPMLFDCTYPPYKGSNWIELAEYGRRLQLIIDECQLQIEVLRAYEEEIRALN